MSFAGVLIRSRARKSPSAIRLRSSPSTVAGEAVSAERDRERGEPRIVRHVGEAVDARRQCGRQRAGPERILKRVIGGFEAEQDTGDRAVRSRQQQLPGRLGLETRGVGIGAGAGVKLRALLRPARRRHEGNGNGGRGAAGEEGWMHRKDR
jgi:hypothetical protein